MTVASGGPAATGEDLHTIWTRRLTLRPFRADEASAVLAGARDGQSWSAGYPTDGDRVIAALVVANPPPDDDHTRFGSYRVQLRGADGCPDLTVGGIGFFGPPHQGCVEVGYGLAPEARGRGLATEALLALLEQAAADPRVLVVQARTTDDNWPSRRVLARAGFELAGRDLGDPAAPALLLRFECAVDRGLTAG